MAESTKLQRVRDIAKRYPDDFIACRDSGHRWKPVEAAWLQDGHIERILECDRCDAQRIQILDKNGYVVAGTYHYSDGYTMTGVGRLDTDGRAIIRRTAVLKLLG